MGILVLRETRARGASTGETVTKTEKWDWCKKGLEFLREALIEGGSKNALQCDDAKLKRLASFYMMHAEDWQMQCSGVAGFKLFYPVEGDVSH